MKRKEFTKQFGCECCRWATKRQQKHIIKARAKAEWKREWKHDTNRDRMVTDV